MVTGPNGPSGHVSIGIQDEPLDAASNSDWISVTSGVTPNEEPEPLPAGQTDDEYQREQIHGAHSPDEAVVRGRVFSSLLPLACEADALLDETGVSRVLQRGKTVVLSREYRDVKSHLEEKEKRRKEVENSTKSSL